MDADCKNWAQGQLGDARLDTPLQFFLVKSRPWSTVWQVESAGQKYYLKAAAPGFDVEPALLAHLTKWLPELVVELVAIQSRRGWLLTRDAGRPLRDVAAVNAQDGLTRLENILAAYADMQIAATKAGAPKLQELLEDRSLARLPQAFESVIQEPGLLATGGATAEEIDRRDEWGALCRDLCATLARSNVPMTLEHGDFHAGNILVAGDVVRIADWGDACWSHPFFSLVACLRNSGELLALHPASSQLQQLKQVYLERWRTAGIGSKLEETYALAQQLRPAHAVLLWSRGLAKMPEEARISAARHMLDWLRVFA
jgi:hypothetical protein